MIKFGIYGIRNIENGKWYIGSTYSGFGFNLRWMKHKRQLNGQYHPNEHLQRAWNKYGSDSFEFIVLEECSDSMLTVREQAWMRHYNSMNNKYGYNLIGADRHIMSQETREKIRKANTGKKHSDETKQKMSIAQTGKKISEDHKIKLHNFHVGKIMSKESRRKLSQSLTGRKLTEKTKNKISIARMGIRNTKEHNENIRLSWILRKQKQPKVLA